MPMKIAKAILRLVKLYNMFVFLFKYMRSDRFKEKIYKMEFAQYYTCVFMNIFAFEKL